MYVLIMHLPLGNCSEKEVTSDDRNIMIFVDLCICRDLVARRCNMLCLKGM
jgi:hypothetical protein